MTICTPDSHQWGQWQWDLPGFQAVGDPRVLINPALTASPYGYWDQQPDWRAQMFPVRNRPGRSRRRLGGTK